MSESKCVKVEVVSYDARHDDQDDFEVHHFSIKQKIFGRDWSIIENEK